MEGLRYTLSPKEENTQNVMKRPKLQTNFYLYTRRPKGSGACYATVIGFVAWSDPPPPI